MKMTKESLMELIKEVNKEVMGDYVNEIQLLKTQISVPGLIGAGQTDAERIKSNGNSVGRIIRALVAGRGDPERASRFAKNQWKDEATSKALAAGEGAAGGFTIGEDMAADLIELLRPTTVVRSAQPMIVDMPAGNMTLPGLATGAQAGYAGENLNGGITEQTFRDVKLSYKKLITLVPVSNDLIRMSSRNSDAIVRDDLIASMGQREDLAFMRGDGANDTPIGFRNLADVTNIFAANATVNLDNVTGDLAIAVLKLKSANVRMIRPTWFMSPRTEMFLMTIRDGNGNYAFRAEMLTGTIFRHPYKVTTQIPENLGGGSDESEVYLVDMADAVLGDSMQITIDASPDAAYHDGSNVQAAFSKDQTVVRAISEHDFNIRHVKSIAIITGVKWAN